MVAPVEPPVFPVEILEEIIDFHAQLDGNADDWQQVGRPWSSSMLALLSASRQLRLCAIRHIFRDIHVYCGQVNRPMDKLRQLIVPDASNLPLGSIAPNIKSLYIHTYAGPSHNMSACIHADEFSELFHSSLLNSIRKQSPLCTLSLVALTVTYLPCPWDALPPDFRRTVIAFFRLPSLKSFKSYGISGMRGEISRYGHLQKLWVANSLSEFGRFSTPAANGPPIHNHHIISLLIHQSFIPNTLCLPNLEHLALARLPLGCLDALWPIITSSWKNIISLEIDDNFRGPGACSYAIPESINISLLPRLEIFKYSHVYKRFNALLQPTVLPPVTFLRVKNTVSALKHVDINIYFEKKADSQEETISRVTKDPSWDILDGFLTSICFPNLEKINITLQQSLAVTVSAQPEEASGDFDPPRTLHLEVESALRPSLSRLLQSASIALRLDCKVHTY